MGEPIIQSIAVVVEEVTCRRCGATAPVIPTEVAREFGGIYPMPRDAGVDKGRWLVRSWRPPVGWIHFGGLGDFCPPCAHHITTAASTR